MESGNSSSMQSSSGGDDQDQYDESSGVGGGVGSGNYFFSNTTARINSTSTNNTITNTNPLPTQYHHHDHQNNPDMFMGSSSSTHQIAPPRLDPPQHHGNFLEPFENHPPNFQNLMFRQTQQFSGGGLVDSPPVQNPSCTLNPNNSNNQQKPSSSNTAGAGGSGSGSGGGKNPRKRTRASRRAPTTVLTTDTSNFRAMVQEFTGIPSSPFSAAASPLLSRRLTDLLAGPSSVGPSLRPGRPPSMMGVGPSSSTLERILAGYNNNSTNNYPFRPSAHKPNNTPQNTNSNNSTNISFQSLLQSNISPSPASTIGTHPSLVGGGSLLPPNVGNFPDLSGVIGGDQMFGFSPEGGGWRGGGSSGATTGGVSSSEERDGNNNVRGGRTGGGMSQQHHPCSSTNDVANNNNTNTINNNNNASNQQMEGGSISGGGTCNYNVNCSGDKGLDSTPNLGGGQGTLGDLLG